MKITLFLLLVLMIFSCQEKTKKSTFEKVKECECEKTIKSDSLFFATNIETRKTANQKSLSFNCSSIETAIASVNDINGNNERCVNLYEIICVSKSIEELKLSNDFSYDSDEIQNMNVTKVEAQNIFFEEVRNTKKMKYFEFNVNNKKEIIAISKLNID